MRSSHWMTHTVHCESCRKGHPCQTGRSILARRWSRKVSAVPVSRAAQTEINVLRLITGGGN